MRLQENQTIHQLLSNREVEPEGRELKRKMILKLQKRLNKKNSNSLTQDHEHRRMEKKNSLDGVIQQMSETEEDDQDNGEMTSSSEEDPDAKANYKNSHYWSLPENVRQAIDTAKKNSRTTCNGKNEKDHPFHVACVTSGSF